MHALAQQILAKIKPVGDLYHRLLLVVAPAGSGKTSSLREVSEQTGARLLNVNLELSRRLLELTLRQRALKLPRLLDDVVHNTDDLVLLDNIEILFDVDLKQDPLRLLQRLSRSKTVVVAWNGSIVSERLTYASPGHREYRHYPIDGLVLVAPDVTA